MLFTDSMNLLLIGLIVFFSLIGGGIVALYFMRINKPFELKEQRVDDAKKKQALEAKNAAIKLQINKFMDFEDVQDDMVIQEKGNRFVMAIRCMGINYDLMSETEMLAVEEGFSNFLNALKYPIQLYVQSRSLDLSEGINLYKKRLDSLRGDYSKFEQSVIQARRLGNVPANKREQMEYQLNKKRTLLDYGADIVNYIERMSGNRNILQRRYYIIVSYHTSELGLKTSFTKDEARDLAYSDLYTKCRSIISALGACGVEASILNSEDLIELLYVAYNKDEADVYNVKRAVNSGLYRLYSTAPDVQEKKRAIIDASVKEQAIAEAELALQKAIVAINEKNNGLTEEEYASDRSKEQAIQMIIDNSQQFDSETVDIAITDLNNQMHVPLVDKEELEEIPIGQNENYVDVVAEESLDSDKGANTQLTDADNESQQENIEG